MAKKEILFHDAAAAYDFGSPVKSIAPYGGGHINDTFLVTTEAGGEYVLQRINGYVFTRPGDIMTNIMGVTEFIAKKLAERGEDTARGTLTVMKTRKGGDYFLDADSNYWRVTLNIPNTTAYDFADSVERLYEAGAAFGRFQSMLADYPADTLFETIPHFHDTPARYEQLMTAVREDKAGRLNRVRGDVAFAEARKEDCSALMALLASGDLPLKVTHNDTKMSNVLIDNETGKAVCVIDLDTVMPGLAAFDFGDSIRAGATTAAEDEADLSKVHFSMPFFTAYAEGFLREAGGSLTEMEKKTLPIGAKLMTLEVGMRFLADYLNGDVYFKTAYPEHNLVRARNQFKLVEEMEQHMDEMQALVDKY